LSSLVFIYTFLAYAYFAVNFLQTKKKELTVKLKCLAKKVTR